VLVALAAIAHGRRTRTRHLTLTRKIASRTRTEKIAPNIRTERILARIRTIPEGFVQTYGDIDPRAPRLVGRVLAELPGPGEHGEPDDLPWHRVVRADGRAPVGRRQLALLAKEGVPIRGDRVEMRRARLPREYLDSG
jgi:methylated-DNA-protein-cysteine methyltransferase related protein